MFGPMFGYLITNTASIRDPYTTPKDRIWGDVIKHERVMELAWKETWEDVIMPKDLSPPENYLKSKPQRKQVLAERYRPKPSLAVPSKASEIIGWRSSVPTNTLEHFNVKYVSNKKRFVKEQFGHYRTLKYYKEAAVQKEKAEEESTPLRDGKFIKHTIKRLVC